MVIYIYTYTLNPPTKLDHISILRHLAAGLALHSETPRWQFIQDLWQFLPNGIRGVSLKLGFSESWPCRHHHHHKRWKRAQDRQFRDPRGDHHFVSQCLSQALRQGMLLDVPQGKSGAFGGDPLGLPTACPGPKSSSTVWMNLPTLTVCCMFYTSRILKKTNLRYHIFSATGWTCRATWKAHPPICFLYGFPCVSLVLAKSLEFQLQLLLGSHRAPQIFLLPLLVESREGWWRMRSECSCTIRKGDNHPQFPNHFQGWICVPLRNSEKF